MTALAEVDVDSTAWATDLANAAAHLDSVAAARSHVEEDVRLDMASATRCRVRWVVRFGFPMKLNIERLEDSATAV